MHLSDKQREKAFPVHIELGKKESNGPAIPMPVGGSGKNGKPRTYYPTAYIDNVPGLENLPEEGCMLVHYRRTSLRIETPEDGEDTAGVTIELRRICLAEGGGEDDEDAPKDLYDALSDPGKAKRKADDSDEGD